MKPYSIEAGTLRLAVRLTPGAQRDGTAGVVDLGDGRTALAIRLAARPVEGAANKALIAFLAARLGVAKDRVAIASGDKSRLKIVRVDGVSEQAVARLVEGQP